MRLEEIPLYQPQQHGNVFHWILRLAAAERKKWEPPERKFEIKKPRRKL
jgi:hypothetical protein